MPPKMTLPTHSFMQIAFKFIMFKFAVVMVLLSHLGSPIYAKEGFAEQHINHDMHFYGEWQQGGIIRGQLLNSQIHDLRINGQAIDVVNTGKGAMVVFGFDRDDKVGQLLTYKINNQSFSKTYRIKKRDYKIQRINGLPKSKVSVDEKHLNRIYKEYDLARKARAIRSQESGFLQDFTPPLFGIITGVYGSQRILNGKPRRPHFGVDIAAPQGTPIVAPAAGVIRLTHEDMFFSGGTLIMDHGAGLSSTFIHLHKILVRKGQRVERGQVIAEVGATGRVTGAHLDWRMNWYKKRVDPSLILSPPLRQKFLQAKKVRTNISPK